VSTIKVAIDFHIPDGILVKKQTITGCEVPYKSITIGDLTDKIRETEAYLSRIMGMEVHINTASE
jgi:hypothetical protein